MNSQQLYDHIIKPTHIYMGRNYESKNANMLSLATTAVESNCCDKIVQDGGPALSGWQIEPKTHRSIWLHCDALQEPTDGRGCVLAYRIRKLMISPSGDADIDLVVSPMYACAIARLKYAMDTAALPHYSDIEGIYAYYKKIFNTEGGASTWIKFVQAWKYNGLDDIVL